MRWRIPKNEFNIQHRRRTKFLWRPKCCNGEWRWLETASWHGDYSWWSYFPMLKVMQRPYWRSGEVA